MKSRDGVGGGYMVKTRSIRAGRLGALSILLTFFVLVSASAPAADQGRIVFASDRTGSWQIYTVNPDGTDQVQVTNLAPTAADGLAPTLSPDGRKVLFSY